MALDSQNLPISFGQGLDTKTDPKQVVPGKLIVLQNASFKTLKEIRKRDGYATLTKNIQNGGTVSSGVGISSYLDELVSLDGQVLYTYSSELNVQISRGLMKPVDLSISSVVRNTTSQSVPDMAYHTASKLKCFTWSDSGFEGANCYQVIDSETGAIVAGGLFPGEIIDSQGKMKVLTLGDNFIFLYLDSVTGFLTYRTVSVSNPTILSSPVLVANDISPDVEAFDATIIDGSAYIVYRKGTTQVAFYSLSPSLAMSSQYVVTVGNAVDAAISICGDASFNVWVSYATTTHLYTFIVNQALNTTLLNPVTVDSSLNATGFVCYNITMAIIGTMATIFYEQFGTSSAFIKSGTVAFSGTVVAGANLILRVGLASKAIVYSGVPYFLSIYAGDLRKSPTGQAKQTSLEPTYFLINSSGKCVLKLCPSLSMLGYFTSGLLPEIVIINGTEFSLPYLIQDAEPIPSANGNQTANTGLNNANFDFQIAQPVSKLVNAANLHLASGQLWMYDSINVVEHGFHIYPENLDYAFPIVAGGGIGPSVNYNASGVNQVQYIGVYRWVDNQGQRHVSATSPALTINLPNKANLTERTFTGTSAYLSQSITSVSSFTGLFVGQVIYDKTNASTFADGTYITALSPGTSSMTVSQPASAAHAGDTFGTVDTLEITVTVPCLTITEKQLVIIDLYRTQNNGTIFYNTGVSIGNETFAESLTITDSTADNFIIGNQELYTTGGEVSNFNAPALSVVTSFKNRAVGLTPESPFQWIYTKEILPGVPLEWSSLLFFENVDQKIGKLTAACQMDDKFILFGPTSKYYVVGSGPSPSGANNDFTDAVRLVGVSGCENQASVLEIPTGLIYQDTQKGFWLLDRSLQEKYIGADVERFNSIKTTSSQLVPDSTKAIYTLENGTNLVYDYYIGQWETDVFPSEAVDSTAFENKIVYIQGDGQILEQTPGEFSDDGLVIPFALETGWMNLAGITGFQRVLELQIFGEYKSPHTLTINTYVDDSDVPSQKTVIPVLQDPGLYNYRITMKQQKCTSIRYQIIETQDPASPGEGLSISALGLRVGVKRGLNKLPAGKSY